MFYYYFLFSTRSSLRSSIRLSESSIFSWYALPTFFPTFESSYLIVLPVSICIESVHLPSSGTACFWSSIYNLFTESSFRCSLFSSLFVLRKFFYARHSLAYIQSIILHLITHSSVCLFLHGARCASRGVIILIVMLNTLQKPGKDVCCKDNF